MRASLVVLFLCACGNGGVTFAMIEQNNSGQNGSATIFDGPKGIDVSVAIKQAGVMRSQLSHIHEGRCDDVRRIVAGVGMDATAMATISQPDGGAIFEGDLVKFHQVLEGRKLSEFTDGNHVINVHDPRDPGLYVSCGEIK